MKLSYSWLSRFTFCRSKYILIVACHFEVLQIFSDNNDNLIFQEMERSGCQEYNTKNLAETLKSQGI